MVSSAAQKTGPAITVGPTVEKPERGDDAEGPPPASQRPEQIGVFVGGRPDDAALGGDHLGGKQVVDGEPVFALRKPMPPPRVSPATPVWPTMPPVVARPCACVSWSTSPTAPPCTTAVRSTGSTVTARIAERSITIRRRTAVPATLWPPPRTAISRSRSRAKHGRDHAARAAGDAGRMAVDRAVPDPAGSVVARAGCSSSSPRNDPPRSSNAVVSRGGAVAAGLRSFRPPS